MDFSDDDIERAARSIMADFGEGAVHEARSRAAAARASGLDRTAVNWDRVLERIEQLGDAGHDDEFREAC